MIENKTFITVKEICEVLSVSESQSYSVVRDLNKELADKGFWVIPGRVSRKYFEERFYGVDLLEGKAYTVQFAEKFGIGIYAEKNARMDIESFLTRKFLKDILI